MRQHSNCQGATASLPNQIPWTLPLFNSQSLGNDIQAAPKIYFKCFPSVSLCIEHHQLDFSNPRLLGDSTNVNAQQPTATTEHIIDQNFLDSSVSESKAGFPEAHMIPEGVGINRAFAKSGGELTDLWEGTYKGKFVAVKVLRLHAVEDPDLLKKSFCKEAAVWSYLHHANVLPFIGVATNPFEFSLVSPWMKHGNIREYTKNNPQANRLPLLEDIVDGLRYLHLENIVHGDLKGQNVLIKDNRRACLADFGLASVTSATISDYRNSAFSGGTLRWMAPELLSPVEFGLQQCIPSEQSDIYAFGMVVYEVITGNSPFVSEIVRNEEVVLKVIRGDRPKRPTDLATINLVEAVWPIAEKCWCQVARDRLTLPQVSEILEVEVSKWKQEMQPCMEEILGCA